MAHGIMENDTMFAVGKTWHGFGADIEDAVTSEQALDIAGLNWQVVKENMYLENGARVPEKYAHVRVDNRLVLGVGTESYQLLQNKDAFAFVDDILRQPGMDAKYESAGSLFNCRKTWVLARLQRCQILGDEYENYMFFAISFDGSCAVRCGLTSVRVVCNNTLQAAIKHAPRIWSMRHTRGLEGRQLEAARALNLTTKYLEETKRLAVKMAVQKVDFNAFVNALFKMQSDGTFSRNTIKAQEKLTDLYFNKPDLQNFKGTAWGALQAVNDFVSNTEPMRKRKGWEERRFSNFIGVDPLIIRAQEILKAA